MGYVASKYFQWYIQGAGKVVLVELAPASLLSRLLWLISCVAICAILLGGTVFKVWNDRHVALKTMCIVVGTLIFAGAVHWVQRTMFLTGLSIASTANPGGEPMMISTQAIPVTTPFVVIMVAQLLLFFLIGFSRPKSGPPPVPVAN